MTDSALYSPTTILLEIKASDQEQAWSQSQHLSDSRRCWRAYLNHLCYLTLLPWLQLEFGTIKPRFSLPSMQSIWEFIHGVEFVQGADRYLFLPSDTVDQSSISIPQEWLSIPEWIPNYYCPVEINIDERYMAVMGYVTHEQVSGINLESNRIYQLELDNLMDWNVLGVSQDLGLSVAAPQIEPLNTLTVNQAQSLITRLGNSDLKFPHLEIPIPQWNALLSHGGWRQSLVEQRWGITQTRSLGDWLQAGIPDWFSNLGWNNLSTQALAGARGESQTQSHLCTRRLEIESQPFELTISKLPEYETGFRFELRLLKPGSLIPQGYILRLLTADLQPFENNEAIASNPIEMLQVDVLLAPEDIVVWEISPTPDQFDYECFTV